MIFRQILTKGREKPGISVTPGLKLVSETSYIQENVCQGLVIIHIVWDCGITEKFL